MANAMQRTQAAEDLRRQRQETAIEELLATYPYLIEEGLPRPRQQVAISPGDRTDLLFEGIAKPLVVEIKADLCDIRSVRQILRYIKILSQEHPQIRGILIGKRLSSEAARALSAHAPLLTFLALNQDIPTSILICADCRRAYCSRKSACPHPGCGSTTIIAT